RSAPRARGRAPPAGRRVLSAGRLLQPAPTRPERAVGRGVARHRAAAVMDRIRLGIVGCGNICQLNAPGYLEHPRCDVVALCDTEWARAEMRARQWGITPRIYKDYAELLDDPAVDAIELLTPTYLHAE